MACPSRPPLTNQTEQPSAISGPGTPTLACGQAFTPNRRFVSASVCTLSELILAHQRYRVSGLLCAVVAEVGQVVTEAQLELGPDFDGPAAEPGAAFADGQPCERAEENVLGFDQVGC